MDEQPPQEPPLLAGALAPDRTHSAAVDGTDVTVREVPSSETVFTSDNNTAEVESTALSQPGRAACFTNGHSPERSRPPC